MQSKMDLEQQMLTKSLNMSVSLTNSPIRYNPQKHHHHHQQQQHQHQHHQQQHHNSAMTSSDATEMIISQEESSVKSPIMSIKSYDEETISHNDYIISDYMDKMATKINILETELKFAWRALDLLSNEYTKMWQRLDKLENITMDQQSIVTNLMGLYTSMTSSSRNDMAGVAGCSSGGISQFENAPTSEFNTILEELKNDALSNDGNNYRKLVSPLPLSFLINDVKRELGKELEGMEDDIEIENFLKENLIVVQNDDEHDTELMVSVNASCNAENDFRDGSLDGNNKTIREMSYDDNQLKMEMQNSQLRDLTIDFFRSGELNRDLYSTQTSHQNMSMDHMTKDNYFMDDDELFGLQNDPPSRSCSSLGMIYEDNEEPETILSSRNGGSTQSLNKLKRSRKKKHKLKDTSQDSNKTAIQTSTVSSNALKSNEQSTFGQDSKILDASYSTIESYPTSYDFLEKNQTMQFEKDREHLVQKVLNEIAKIEDLSKYNNDKLDILRNIIRKEYEFFEKLKKVDSNLTLFLLNPITGVTNVTNPDEHFEKLKTKLTSNIDILKKLLQNDQSSELTNIFSSKNQDFFQEADDRDKFSVSSAGDFTKILLKDNTNINHELKMLNDILDNRVKSISTIIGNPIQNIDKYNDDDYIKSLKKSMDRHNSMLYLLKLQDPNNPNPSIEEDSMSSGSHSPPPPAPNGHEPSINHSNMNTFSKRSDSGLSSMSGMSSLEKSSVSLRNAPRASSFSSTNTAQIKDTIVYSEENLNFIKEISKNVPICSTYENKSIYEPQKVLHYPDLLSDEKTHHHQYQNQQQHQHNTQHQHKHQQSLPEYSNQKYVDRYRRTVSEPNNQNYPEENYQEQHLIDRLVYYPNYDSTRTPQQTVSNTPSYLYNQAGFVTIATSADMQENKHSSSSSSHNNQHSHHGHNKYIEKFSSWLPDIKLKKLSKNHRSNSLPSDVEDVSPPVRPHKITISKNGKKSQQVNPLAATSKKKKRGLVSAMSNIMQKAKLYRRHSLSYSSPPEQNGTTPTFKTMSVNRRKSRNTSYSDPETDFFSDNNESFSEAYSENICSPPSNISFNVSNNTSNQEQKSPTSSVQNEEEEYQIEVPNAEDNTMSQEFDEELSEDPHTTMSSASKSSMYTNSSNKNNKFIFSSSSMEFAVSRKIGKYRQKNHSSDENQPITPDASSFEENIKVPSDEAEINVSGVSPSLTIPMVSTTITPSISPHLQKTHSIFVEDENLFDDVVTLMNGARPVRYGQKSLEIPSRDDEDSRSQHSYRTMSSSRRQSTEDSIDTDDEYFCYELRKLEELERQSHFESLLDNSTNKENSEQILSQIDQLNELNELCPNEEVTRNMTHVLAELKSKVKLVYTEEFPKQMIKNENSFAMKNSQKSNKTDIYEKFGKATNYYNWDKDEDDEGDNEYANELYQLENEIMSERMKAKKYPQQRYQETSDSEEDEFDERKQESPVVSIKSSEKSRASSGDTSGPDSPYHTDDDLDHDQNIREEKQLPEKKTSPNNYESQQNNIADDQNDSIFMENYDAKEIEIHDVDNDMAGAASIIPDKPLRKQLTQELSQESTTSGQLSSSKWKLLKTLKERKIEEKNNLDKSRDDVNSSGKEKVSCT